MLQSLDTLIAFSVIMVVLSLVITVFVQMISTAFALRGKNLANALALTFQSIDPRIGHYANDLAERILKDPLFSDSLFAAKTRGAPHAALGIPAIAALIAAEKTEAAARAANQGAAASAVALANAVAALLI